MFSTIYSGAVCGLQAYLIRVEVDLAGGLPAFLMVGSLGSEVRIQGKSMCCHEKFRFSDSDRPHYRESGTGGQTEGRYRI